MTSPNWNKSPPGATHYGPLSKSYPECWYRKVEGGWQFNKGHGSKWYPLNKPPTKFRFGRMQVRPVTGYGK